MRIRAFLVGLLVLAAFGAGVLFTRPWEKGAAAVKPGSPAPQPVRLVQGTHLELLLLTALDSGGSAEGSQVDLVLAKPVSVGGKTVLPAGSRAVGKVTQSRGASVFSGMANRPARLAVSVESIQAPDGAVVLLSASDDGTFEFTQANTSGRKDAARVDRLWQTPEGQQVLKDFAAKSTGIGQADEVDLKRMADVLGLEDTRKVADRLDSKNRKSGPSAQDAVNGLMRGDLSQLTGIDLVMATRALGEIQSVVASVDDKLRGVFKGSNIHATAGTPVQAKVKEDAKLMPVGG
ncbi:MAG: hypothetical protein JSS65_15110 [Armatimonadetes bacterium]|nr:hypothetical protein [Armatimonadota bacterium]